MFSENRRRRVQRATVGVIIGALVLSLALSLLSSAGAVGLPLATPDAHSAVLLSKAPAHVPALPRAATDQPVVGTSDDPKPVTKTPQGQATQVTDEEHIGGLVAFIAFMTGGFLLLLRGRRRDRRERQAESILS